MFFSPESLSSLKIVFGHEKIYASIKSGNFKLIKLLIQKETDVRSVPLTIMSASYRKITKTMCIMHQEIIDAIYTLNVKSENSK